MTPEQIFMNCTGSNCKPFLIVHLHFLAPRIEPSWVLVIGCFAFAEVDQKQHLNMDQLDSLIWGADCLSMDQKAKQKTTDMRI